MDDETIITGCEDGLVRAIGVHPNKILSVLHGVADNADKASPIQRVAVSCDALLGAAISESTVSFFNLKYVKERDKSAKGRPEPVPDPFFGGLQSEPQ